jgi:hypothetical protein
MGKILADVIRWQLGNPNGTKEQCLDLIRAQAEQGKWSAEFSKTQHHTNDGKRGKPDASGAAVKKIRA